MKLILFLLKASWRIVTMAIVIGAVSGVANTALLFLIFPALRKGAGPSAWVIGFFAGLCPVVLLTRIGSQALLSRLTQDTISRLRLGLCRKILASPLRHLEEIGMHRMLAALINDVGTVTHVLNTVPTIVVNFVILLCGAGFLGYLSLKILAGAAVFCALGVATYLYFASFAKRHMRAGVLAQESVIQNVRELIDGVKQLKMHAERRRVFVDDVMEPTEAAMRRFKFVADCLQNAAIVWGRLMFFVALGVLAFVMPLFLDIDHDTRTWCTITILFLMAPLDQIMAFLPAIGWATVAIERIERTGLMLDMGKVEQTAAPAVRQWNQIEVAGVTHSYRKEGRPQGFLLGPIDFTLRPGEIVFIVGGNGSGKTTLAKLFTGLYTPESGEIRLDGQPVTAENREGYRQLFSVVFDDAAVFDSLWGLESDDLDRRAREYLDVLRLSHVVKVQDGKFSTTKLSRGQRKRLALLTAYIEDRPIYVFDEWAADQDPTFRKLFYLRILPELKERGKSVVAITHDDHYFGVADCLIKLDEGKMNGRTSI